MRPPSPSGAWPCRRRRALLLAAAAAGLAGVSHAAPAPTRQQALRALDDPLPARRAAAVDRLAEVGTMADAARVADRLHDADPTVHERAAVALWQIWSRSGDRAIDRQLLRGVQQMQSGELEAALKTFDGVVRRKPDFAEGWNKRATVLYLLGRDVESLRDCDAVLARNPLHFGALSGMAQIHLRRDDPESALRAYERALAINPHLDGGPEFLRLLEETVRRRGGQRT